MSRVLVVGEDALTCALGERMIAEVLPDWSLAKQSINTRGVTRLVPALPRYFEQAKYVQPVVCIADTDGRCPVELLAEWAPNGTPAGFVLRLAVSEAESWLLADQHGAAEFFGVSPANLPKDPEALPDAKLEVLRLARMSRVRPIRQEVVSAIDPHKPGTGYNAHLCKFVLEGWRASRARLSSQSLDRALTRLSDLGAEYS